MDLVSDNFGPPRDGDLACEFLTARTSYVEQALMTILPALFEPTDVRITVEIRSMSSDCITVGVNPRSHPVVMHALSGFVLPTCWQNVELSQTETRRRGRHARQPVLS